MPREGGDARLRLLRRLTVVMGLWLYEKTPWLSVQKQLLMSGTLEVLS